MSQEQYSVDTVIMQEGTFVVSHAKGVFYILTMISTHVQVCQQCIVRGGFRVRVWGYRTKKDQKAIWLVKIDYYDSPHRLNL